MKNFTHNFRILKIGILLFLCLDCTPVAAQLPDPPDGGIPLNVVIDGSGNKYSLSEISTNDDERMLARGITPSSPLFAPLTHGCTAGYFNVYYDVNSGFNATDADPLAATEYLNRRAVLCGVLNDISNFIPSPLPPGHYVNIWVKPTSVAGTVLGIGSPFYYVPYSLTASEIADNTAWITINSGTDAFTNVVDPLAVSGGGSTGSTYFHGSIAFNWNALGGVTLNWNDLLGAAPGPGQIDMYTVALHEMMHLLGFATLINFDGTSVLGPDRTSTTPSGFTAYTRYDTHLQTLSGIPLITNGSSPYTSSSCDLYQWQFNTALGTAASALSPGGIGIGTACVPGYQTGTLTDHTNCSNRIVYSGSWPVPIPVYTPDCFERGSSLSHFEDECYVPSYFVLGSTPGPATNDQYFLLSNAAPPLSLGRYDALRNPGPMKRYLTPEERQVLCDIGYHVNTKFGIAGTAGTYPYPSGPNLNYYDYGGTACPGFGVAGINDGINAGAYSYVYTGVPKEINLTATPLLSNDYGADAFKCLEVVVPGSGTVSTDNGNNYTSVKYNPSFGTFGPQLLRYIPYNTTTGVEGNVTYVYVLVPDGNCISSPCNLVANGDFENVNPADDWGEFVTGKAHCWFDFEGSPNLLATDAPLPAGFASIIATADLHPLSLTTNHHEVFMGTGVLPGGEWVGEGLIEQLSSSLVPGQSYTLSFWAMVQAIDGQPTHLIFGAGNPSPMPFGGLGEYISYPGLGAYGLNLMDEFYLSPSWQYYSVSIASPTAAENVLAIQAAPWDDNPATHTLTWGDKIVIDDISIVPTTASCTMTLPPSLCNTDPSFDLSSRVSIPGGTFTWLTTTSMVVTTSPIFDPAGAYNASITAGYGGTAHIRYDYTDALGCSQTIYGSIRVYPPPVAIVGATTVCPGSTSSLSDGVARGSWSSSATTIASVNAVTGTLYGVATGDATISYSFSPTCSTTMIEHVVTGPGAITVSPPLAICTGNTALLSVVLPGCTWSSSNTTVAPFTTVSGGAIVTGAAIGTSVLTATSTATGCTSSATITVVIPPTAYAMIGGGSYCAGGGGVHVGLTNSQTGVSYQLLFGGVAVGSPIAGTGSALDFGARTAAGTYTILATTTGSSCTSMMSGTITVSIVSYPSVYTVTGGGNKCSAGPDVAIGLSGSQTGVSYQLFNGSSPVGSTVAGTGSALSFGTFAIAGTYTVIATTATAGCTSSMAGSATITLYTSPASIAGPTSVCVWATILLSDATAGGTWSSGSTAIAGVVPTGSPSVAMVTGIGSGTVNISYTVAGGCTAVASIVVNPLPATITGPTLLCYPGSITLSDAMGGGTWTSSMTSVAAITSTTGVLTGIATGTTIITYTLPTGCLTTTGITANAAPGPIEGYTVLVCGSSTTLSDATPGGTWTSTTTTVAIIDPSTGVVTSTYVSGPPPWSASTTITYTLADGCTATAELTLMSESSTFDGLCACGTFREHGGYDLLGSSGTITTDVLPGNYYIQGDVTIDGNITMTDAIVDIASGVHIYVSPNSSLTSRGCHLFTCNPDMWTGIVLKSDGTQTGTVILEGGDRGLSTLIENALIAVDVENPITPTSGAPLPFFVASLNTIFNQNNVGIQVGGYNPVSPATYEFMIEHTVFTSRNIHTTSTYTVGTPFVWESAGSLMGPTPVATVYMAPYHVADFLYAPCNNGLPATGIYLNGIGTSAYPVISGITVGEPNTSDPYAYGSGNYPVNLFDTLSYGIRAVNANLTCENNVFMDMSGQGNAGICATVTNHAPYALAVQPGVYTYGRGGIWGGYTNISPNYFYNCDNAVYAGSYSYVTGTGSYMITNQDNNNCCHGGTFYSSGFYGYNIISGQNYKTVINNNTIINIANGIAMKVPGRTAAALVSPTPLPSQIMIDSNTIKANITAVGNCYVDKPIWVDIPVTYLMFGGAPITAQINTDNNNITNAYNGIYINGANSQVSTSNGNTINGMEYPGGVTDAPQFGISHWNCVNDQVVHNNITGTDYTDDAWKGVQLMHGMTHMVTCNDVSTIGVGFEFNGVGVSSTWRDNNMTNNGKGFLLGGIIGPQGDATHLCSNHWLTSGTTFEWSSFYQTYTENSISPASSPLYVTAGAILDPWYNGAPLIGRPIDICSHTYGCVGLVTTGSGNGLNVLPGSDWPEDLDCYNPYNIGRAMLERMVRQDLSYSTYPNLNYWMGQYAVWEALQQNDTLADSSDILIAFSLMANNSRFSLFTKLEDTLAIGDAADAQIMLDAYSTDSMNNNQYDSSTGVQMADDTTADNIVLNYRRFYQLYINYLDTAMTSSDSASVTALALLCPITNGSVVFKARALYDIIYDTLVLFPNTCSDSLVFDSSAMRHSAPIITRAEQKDTTQKYTLFPNPNDGNFELQQTITDNAPVQMEIWDAVGQSIYKYELQFTNAVSKLNVRNVAPGLYLLQVADSKGRTFRFKFVVE